MVIHPKDLDDATLFAIDQFILSGGNALFFVDPLAESDRAQPDPNNPMVMPDMDSDLKVFLDGWGIEVVDSKLAHSGPHNSRGYLGLYYCQTLQRAHRPHRRWGLLKCRH